MGPQNTVQRKIHVQRAAAPSGRDSGSSNRRFVAIDSRQPVPDNVPGIRMLRGQPTSGGSSFWTVLARWEANAVAPERPNIVLTSDGSRFGRISTSKRPISRR